MIGEPVVFISRTATGTDRRNEPVYSETRTTVEGCIVAPRSSSEDNDGRAAVIVGFTVFAPPGTAVSAQHRLEVRGDLYEVDGEPGIWSNPFTGRNHGIEIPLRKVAG